jgi:hypothetical protein
MRYQIRSIPIGRNFRSADGSLYVRIPDMILEFGRETFSVNCMRLVSSSDPFNSPTVFGGYFHPDTVVDMCSLQPTDHEEVDALYRRGVVG